MPSASRSALTISRAPVSAGYVVGNLKVPSPFQASRAPQARDRSRRLHRANRERLARCEARRPTSRARGVNVSVRNLRVEHECVLDSTGIDRSICCTAHSAPASSEQCENPKPAHTRRIRLTLLLGRLALRGALLRRLPGGKRGPTPAILGLLLRAIPSGPLAVRLARLLRENDVHGPATITRSIPPRSR